MHPAAARLDLHVGQPVGGARRPRGQHPAQRVDAARKVGEAQVVARRHAAAHVRRPCAAVIAAAAGHRCGRHRLDPLLLDHPSIHIPRSFRETSRDGQWVAVFVDKGRNGTPHILTVDLDAREVVVDRPVHDFGCNQDPKWVGVDPDGDFLLVQSSVAGEALCQGLWAYDIETGAPVRQITNHTHTGALGRDPLGDPYYLSMEIPFPDEGIFATPTRYRFDGTQKVPVGPSVPVDSMEHISCTGDAGDACLISARWDGGGAYEGQLWWLSYNGAHLIQGPHHAGGCHIWGNAQAVVGPEGQYAYATHDGSCANVRSVIVDL